MPKYIPKIPVTPEGRRELYRSIQNGFLEFDHPVTGDQVFDFDEYADYRRDRDEDKRIAAEIAEDMKMRTLDD